MLSPTPIPCCPLRLHAHRPTYTIQRRHRHCRRHRYRTISTSHRCYSLNLCQPTRFPRPPSPPGCSNITRVLFSSLSTSIVLASYTILVYHLHGSKCSSCPGPSDKGTYKDVCSGAENLKDSCITKQVEVSAQGREGEHRMKAPLDINTNFSPLMYVSCSCCSD